MTTFCQKDDCERDADRQYWTDVDEMRVGVYFCHRHYDEIVGRN